jgi:hypothetical protein
MHTLCRTLLSLSANCTEAQAVLGGLVLAGTVTHHARPFDTAGAVAAALAALETSWEESPEMVLVSAAFHQGEAAGHVSPSAVDPGVRPRRRRPGLPAARRGVLTHVSVLRVRPGPCRDGPRGARLRSSRRAGRRSARRCSATATGRGRARSTWTTSWRWPRRRKCGRCSGRARRSSRASKVGQRSRSRRTGSGVYFE